MADGARRAGLGASGIVLLFACAMSTVSCKGVLGLDAPELDTCAAGCADGGPDGVIDASGDGSPGLPGQDAAALDARDTDVDQGPIKGLPCGAAGAGLIGCEGATPTCCQTTTGGTTTYSCKKNATACDGYPITCLDNDQCSGSDVCCHGKSAIECTGVSDCADTALVCNPSGPDSQCPGGWSCSGSVSNAGDTLPYHVCAH